MTPELSARAEIAGFQLLHVTRAESTNVAAQKAVLAGVDRIWIVADEQTEGRGRHGRSWASPPGNLYASVGLASPAGAAHVPKLGFVAGLSLAEAILALAPWLGPVLTLKWPNDCLIADAKCAGILLEGVNLPGGGTALAIGIGVNVAHFPEGLERPATALADHVRDIDVPALFATLSERFALNLALFDRGAGFGAIREAWMSHGMAKGAGLRVRLPAGEQQGHYAGIDASGHLLLEISGRIETVLVGDVFPVGAFSTPEAAMRAGA